MLNLLIRQSYGENEFLERCSRPNDLSLSTNIAKRLFIVIQNLLDVDFARGFAGKVVENVESEVSDEVSDICSDICDGILNATKNVNNASEVDKVNEVALDFFA